MEMTSGLLKSKCMDLVERVPRMRAIPFFRMSLNLNTQRKG
jgi:hypothetical protein